MSKEDIKEIKIIYNINKKEEEIEEDEEKIRIFWAIFVENNKNKYKMII